MNIIFRRLPQSLSSHFNIRKMSGTYQNIKQTLQTKGNVHVNFKGVKNGLVKAHNEATNKISPPLFTEAIKYEKGTDSYIVDILKKLRELPAVKDVIQDIEKNVAILLNEIYPQNNFDIKCECFNRLDNDYLHIDGSEKNMITLRIVFSANGNPTYVVPKKLEKYFDQSQYPILLNDQGMLKMNDIVKKIMADHKSSYEGVLFGAFGVQDLDKDLTPAIHTSLPDSENKIRQLLEKGEVISHKKDVDLIFVTTIQKK